MVKDILDVHGYNSRVVDMPESSSKAPETGSTMLVPLLLVISEDGMII
jgi:hypothetical protein